MLYRLRAVLFDLGGTLMDAREPWPGVFERADQALQHDLRRFGVELEAAEFRKHIQRYHALRAVDLYETSYHVVLREVLLERGYGDVEEPILRSGLDAMYRVTQQNWVLRPGAEETLRKLRAYGLRLGVVSNAADDKDVQELVVGFGLRPLLDFVLTSAACSYRKPHPRIFEIALSHWILSPEAAAMVGDEPGTDIAGAKAVGLFTVLLAPAELTRQAAANHRPDACISSLAELPAVLKEHVADEMP